MADNRMQAGPGDGTGLPVAAGAGEAAVRPRLIAAPPRRTGWARVRRWMRRNPLSVAGASIVLGLVLMAILAPYLPLQNPVRMNVSKRFPPPDATFWFGSDHLGRDVFSRVVNGAGFSLAIGAFTIVLAGVPGCSSASWAQRRHRASRAW